MSGARSQLIMEIFLLHAGAGRKGRGKNGKGGNTMVGKREEE